MRLDEASAKRYARKSAFLEFCERDGLSTISGYGVDDLKTAPLKLEWKSGSLFSAPLNVKHQHYNGSADEPVRFATANNLPLIMNVYNSPDFVFNVPYEFTDRFAGQKDFFSSDMKPGEQEDRVVNFIPDLT